MCFSLQMLQKKKSLMESTEISKAAGIGKISGKFLKDDA